MTDPEWIAAVAALFSSLGLLARTLYAEMRDRAQACDEEVADLRRQAQATTDAKNAELAEWKRLALEANPAARHRP